MKVKELIAKLQKFDPETEVKYAINDNEQCDRPVKLVWKDPHENHVVLSDE